MSAETQFPSEWAIQLWQTLQVSDYKVFSFAAGQRTRGKKVAGAKCKGACASPEIKIYATCKSPGGDMLAVALRRTNTTLAHRQQTENVVHEGAPDYQHARRNAPAPGVAFYTMFRESDFWHFSHGRRVVRFSLVIVQTQITFG
jgi:hypothetical protein